MNHPQNKVEFPGNPKLYLRIAVISSLLWVVGIYGGTALILYLSSGKTALLDWKLLLGAAIFTAWYARFAYRWMMRADAQWGSGSGWDLQEHKVKLPGLKSHSR